MRVLIVLATLAASLAAQDSKTDLSGVWIAAGSTDIGVQPAYTAAAQKIWDEHKKNLKKEDPATYCLPNGAVRVGAFPYKIVQTPKLVVVLSEGNTHSYRRFFLDGRAHNLDVDPASWTGDSIGKWEGDTLVVDTVGFNDKSWLDDTGKPHSEEMHVIERYRRTSPKKLEVQYTVEDPKFLTKPLRFTRTFNLAEGRELREQFCTDTNHLTAK